MTARANAQIFTLGLANDLHIYKKYDKAAKHVILI